MALTNYDWTSTHDTSSNSPVYLDRGSGLATTVAPTDEFETAGIVSRFGGGGQFTAKPSSDVFTKRRNGKFTFIYDGFGPEGYSEFRFFKQDLDSAGTSRYYRFFVDRHQAFSSSGIGGGAAFTFYDVGFGVGQQATHLKLRYPVPSQIVGFSGPKVPTDGMVFQIEWLTNAAQDTPLSTDPGNPDYPAMTIILRINTNSADPSDALPVLCHLEDLSRLDTTPDNSANSFYVGPALEFWGPAYSQWLDDINQQFASNVYDSVQGNPLGQVIHLAFQRAAQGKFFSPTTFQNAWAINLDAAGFDQGTSGFGVGLIEPVETEDWDIGPNVVGWRFEAVGLSELAILLIEELWSAPGQPSPSLIHEEFWPAPPPLTPTLEHGETWEPPGALSPTLQHGETWES